MKAYMQVAACVGVLLPMVASAELYKWTDHQGNFHITDTPPPSVQKNSTTTAAQSPRSLPKKAKISPVLPGQPQAELRPIAEPTIPSSASEKVPIQPTMEGLSPSQATLISSWHIFDGIQANAKAPVQWWKDQQGLDHFVDVLPKGATEAGAKIEDVLPSRPARRAKERSAGVSHLPRRGIE